MPKVPTPGTARPTPSDTEKVPKASNPFIPAHANSPPIPPTTAPIPIPNQAFPLDQSHFIGFQLSLA